MINLNLIEFWQNLSASINGKKRQDYKRWEQILVNNEDLRYLQRLWCKLIASKEIEYKENKDYCDWILELEKKTKKKKDKVEETEGGEEE